MRILKQSSTAQPLMFLLVSSSDHITGLTGATPTVKIGKSGAAGAAPSGAVSEVDSTNLPGWYKVAGNATDTGTLGPLVLHASASGSDPVDIEYEVVAFDPQVTYITAGTGTGQINPSSGKVPATLASTDVTGNVAADIQTIKTQAVTAPAGVTFPTSIASPTNITAGTITTVTNLTNAPTSGDFTSAMKTSLNAATPASVVGAVGSVTGSVGSISGITFPTNFSVLSISATTGLVTFANTTIGTATNLTNAPTNGDFTAAMKTSLNAATPAVTVSDKTGFSLSSSQTFNVTGNITGNLSGSVGSVTGAVALATAQPNYAPAKAGDAMALTSGERTTLAAAIWNALTSGLTTAGSVGKGLAAFLADFANMITGTGTSTPEYTTDSLKNAPGGSSTITVTPASSTVSTGVVTSSDLTAYEGSAPAFIFAVVDATGAPIDLSAKTVKFTASADGSADPLIVGPITATISGTDNNQATVQLATGNTASVQTLLYSLWNETDNLILARGRLSIKIAAQQA